VWDTKTGIIKSTLEGNTRGVCRVFSVSFSPDGKYICSGSADKTVKLWNTETGKNIDTLTDHTSSVTSVSFSPDGNYICSGSSDKTVRVWNTHTETDVPIRTLEGHTGVTCVSFSPKGEYICSGSGDNTVRVWDIEQILKEEKKTSILDTPQFMKESEDY